MKNYKTKLRLNTVSSVNNLMARCINSFIDGGITQDEARTIGYLANILYKGIEQEESLNLEEQQTRIKHMQTKTNKLNNIGNDIEDLSELREMLGFTNYYDKPKEA